MEPWYWLILFVVLVVIELFTMGLTTIWFAVGAIAAMAVNMLGGNIWFQCVVFLVVSFLVMLFTRPFAVRYINHGHVRTNVDELIGASAYVTEAINNLQSTGKVQVKGQEWTARAIKDDLQIDTGKVVEITAIKGVKLIVKEKEEK